MSAVMTEKTDSELQRTVLDELNWEPSVNAIHIGVSVKNGIVTLSGHVSSYWQKYEAEKAVKRVYGVTAVANELSVKLPDSSQSSDEDIASSQSTDEDIATACVNALKASISVPSESL